MIKYRTTMVISIKTIAEIFKVYSIQVKDLFVYYKCRIFKFGVNTNFCFQQQSIQQIHNLPLKFYTVTVLQITSQSPLHFQEFLAQVAFHCMAHNSMKVFQLHQPIFNSEKAALQGECSHTQLKVANSDILALQIPISTILRS